MEQNHPYIDLLKDELAAYFEGRRREFSVPVALPGTDFQKQVSDEVANTPYGQTLSYRQLAEKIQKPEAVRAVANAVGKNRLALIIPCHRIVGSNGGLTGYAWGLWRKQWLLEMEQAQQLHLPL